MRVPDLLIHIDASLPTLRRRIALRGRAYEQDIPDAYLGGLNRLYDEWISAFDDCPVVRVNGDLGRLGGLLKLWLTDDPRTARFGDATILALLGRIEATQDEMSRLMKSVVQPRAER